MRRLSSVAVLLSAPITLVVGACSETPTGPVQLPLEATDTPAGAGDGLVATLREMLDDPLLHLLLANLEDQAAAQLLRSSLDEVRAALDGQDRAPEYAAALKDAEAEFARVRGSLLSPDDEIALAVLSLMLDVRLNGDWEVTPNAESASSV